MMYQTATILALICLTNALPTPPGNDSLPSFVLAAPTSPGIEVGSSDGSRVSGLTPEDEISGLDGKMSSGMDGAIGVGVGGGPSNNPGPVSSEGDVKTQGIVGDLITGALGMIPGVGTVTNGIDAMYDASKAAGSLFHPNHDHHLRPSANFDASASLQLGKGAVDAQVNAGLNSGTGAAIDGQFNAGWKSGNGASADAQMNAGWNSGTGAAIDGQFNAGWKSGNGASADAQMNAGWNSGNGAAIDGQFNAGWKSGNGASADAQMNAGWNSGNGAGRNAAQAQAPPQPQAAPQPPAPQPQVIQIVQPPVFQPEAPSQNEDDINRYIEDIIDSKINDRFDREHTFGTGPSISDHGGSNADDRVTSPATDHICYDHILDEFFPPDPSSGLCIYHDHNMEDAPPSVLPRPMPATPPPSPVEPASITNPFEDPSDDLEDLFGDPSDDLEDLSEDPSDDSEDF
ncbi:hypothetical protein BDU57DRAFT_540880 [Ampelomyces quisqualis]|uniref:Uncharacterized protein n=1 Tax=Ampelomyces quisqualis TaxID=50730 RepID=A0A6A5QDL8_AMPQU|nr:hypothetical protein BDU57DRAFT_540880 [Ampelomyces quisqualis]